MAAEKEAGRVTSAAWSPALARHLALAYVHHDYIAAGTDVGIGHDAGLLRARVAALPFVSHQ